MIRRRFIGRIARMSHPDDRRGVDNLINLIVRNGSKIAIFLNGREQDLNFVYAADSAEGWIEIFSQATKVRTFPVYDRLSGHVEIWLEKPRQPRVPGNPWEW